MLVLMAGQMPSVTKTVEMTGYACYGPRIADPDVGADHVAKWLDDVARDRS